MNTLLCDMKNIRGFYNFFRIHLSVQILTFLFQLFFVSLSHSPNEIKKSHLCAGKMFATKIHSFLFRIICCDYYFKIVFLVCNILFLLLFVFFSSSFILFIKFCLKRYSLHQVTGNYTVTHCFAHLNCIFKLYSFVVFFFS